MRISVCIENPRDAVAWNRILLLVDGVGPRTAEKVIDDIVNRRASAEQDATDTTLPAFWSQFNSYPDKVRDLFAKLSETSHHRTLRPADKIQQLLPYYEPIFAKRYDDWNKRRKDLEMFQQIAERYRALGSVPQRPDPRTGQRERHGHHAHPTADDEKLILSTIHSAKGLEWNSVFVIYALDGRFPSTRAAMSEESMEEERRLMYVACTRAKEHLYHHVSHQHLRPRFRTGPLQTLALHCGDAGESAGHLGH